MSNQNLVPRTDLSGSIGIPSKRWGSGSFANLDVDELGVTDFTATNAKLTGSLSGSFKGTGSGDFNGTFSGSASGSFQGTYVGDGSQLINIIAIDTGSIAGIQLVSNNGGQVQEFSTISGALAQASSSDVVLVGPGAYDESDLIVKENVQLIGKPALNRGVELRPANSSTNYIVSIKPTSTLAYFDVIGAEDDNPLIVANADDSVGETPYLKEVAVSTRATGSQQIGLQVGGAGLTVVENFSVFPEGGEALKAGVEYTGEAGSRLYINNVRVSGVGTSIFLVTGSGGQFDLHEFHVAGNNVDWTYGLNINSNTVIDLVSVELTPNVSSSIYFNENSDGCILDFVGGDMKGINDDLLIHPSASGAGTRFIHTAIEFRENRINDQTNGTWFNNALLQGLYLDEGEGDIQTKLGIFGEFSVGAQFLPSKASFGEGRETTLNQRVIASGSGGFVNLREDASSISASTFQPFPNDSGSGATFYIGNTTKRFSGFLSNVQSAQTGSLPTAGVWEYFSASAWHEFNTMNADLDEPHEQYGQQVWNQSNTKLTTRYDGKLVAEDNPLGWELSSVNGVEAYWTRYRLTSSLSQSAVLESLESFHNTTVIDEDGFVEFYGTATKDRDLLYNKRLEYDLAGKVPSAANVNFSPSLEFVYLRNVFSDSAVDGLGAILIIPEGLDTSQDIELIIDFVPGSNGSPSNVELKFIHALAETGQVLNGTLSEVSQSQIVEIGTNDALRLKRASFSFSIPNAVPDDFLAVGYQRDARVGNANDTFAGDVRIVSVELRGQFWN